MRTRVVLAFTLAAGAAGFLLPAAAATRPAGGAGEKPAFTQGLKNLVQRAIVAEQRALKAKTLKKAIAALKASEKLLDQVFEMLRTDEGRLLPSAQEIKAQRWDAYEHDGFARTWLGFVQGGNKKKDAARIKKARKLINVALKAKHDLLALIPAEVDLGCKVQTKTEFPPGQPAKKTLQVVNCTTALTEIRLANGKLPTFGEPTITKPDGTASPATCSLNGVLSCPVSLPPGAVFSLPIVGTSSGGVAKVLLVAAGGVSFSAAVF